MSDGSHDRAPPAHRDPDPGQQPRLKDGTVDPARLRARLRGGAGPRPGVPADGARALEFDVCEMALTTYLAAKAHGVAFTALPVFLVRGFHHGAIRSRAGAGIRSRRTSRAGGSGSTAATR